MDSWPSVLGSRLTAVTSSRVQTLAGLLQELNCSRRSSGYFTLIGDEARRSSPLVNFVLLTPETAGLVGIW